MSNECQQIRNPYPGGTQVQGVPVISAPGPLRSVAAKPKRRKCAGAAAAFGGRLRCCFTIDEVKKPTERRPRACQR
jgi:hypothetical protein